MAEMFYSETVMLIQTLTSPSSLTIGRIPSVITTVQTWFMKNVGWQ